MHSNDLADRPTRGPVDGAPGAASRTLDGVLLRAYAAALSPSASGRLHITMPSGRSAVVGPATVSERSRPAGVDATLNVRTYAALWNGLRRGAVGFAESYMAGEIETDSLERLFNYYMDNDATPSATNRCLRRSSWRDKWFHHRRANTPTGSRRNIAEHYDLGNEFYRLWLDAGLTYSSGIYVTPDVSLETAQKEKYARVVDALDIQAGQTVLEVGCGWGGFMQVAASLGARVTGITISREQHAEARARMARLGFGDRVDIRFEDYRETSGSYDRIASIEMIEAVGADNWSAYFRMIHDRLKPGGSAVIQAITIDPDLYPIYRANPDFIQRYIFPGGMLPTVDAIQRHASAVGLEFENVETFGASYALTLGDWTRRFDQAWPRIEALGFDERFKRMWHYYLAYCKVGFERGTIDVGLYRLRKLA